MKLIENIIFIFCFLLLPSHAKIFAQDWRLRAYDTRHGMPSSYIRSINQDSKGRIWITTNQPGVTSFSGLKFKFYDVPVHPFLDIYEDSDNMIWMLSTERLYVFMSNIFSPVNIVLPDSTDRLSAFFIDKKQDDLWLFCISGKRSKSQNGKVFIFNKSALASAKKTGLLKITAETPVFTVHTKSPAYARFVSAGENNLWVSVRHCLYRWDGSNLSLIDSIPDTHRPDWAPNIQDIATLSPDTVVVCTRPGNIYKIAKNYRTLIAQTGLEPCGLINRDHKFWVLHNQGLEWFSKDFKKRGKPEILDMPDIKHATRLLADSEGNIWIGTTQGLWQLKPSSIKSHRVYNEKNWKDGVFGLLSDNSGELLIGSNARYGLWKRKISGSIQKVDFKTTFRSGALLNILLQDRYGDLWAGSHWNGLQKILPNGLVLLANPKLFDNGAEIHRLFEDSAGHLWILSSDGSIWYSKNNTSGRMPEFSKLTVSISPISGAAQWAIPNDVAEGHGRLWFGTEMGLISYVPFSTRFDTFPIQHFLQTNKNVTNIEIKSLYIGIDKTLWVATAGYGVLQFQIKNGTELQLLNHFSTQNGLLTNYPIALAMDNKQRLWVGANHGLSVIFFEKNKPVVLQYQSDEGFPEIVSDRIALAAVNDTMWIGTYSGLFSIPTKNLELKPAKIYLEGLRTNTGYQIDFTQKKTTQQIIFSSDVKNIIFYFSSVSLTYPDHAKILCRLIDRDINWVDASRQDSILYNDLTPGKYTFSIKAINHLGLETEESTVSFIIEKPFWQTWWFILLTILATSLLLIQITAYLVKWKEAEKYKKRKAAFTLRVQQLRVQQMRMNPHFISNAIGGVEQLVRRGENETAFDYLRLFYKYLRRVQEMTNNHILVSVEEEAEILKWYIALESLSMGKNLVSHVIIERTNDEDEEIDAIKIPALMVQPLVENALKHGLFHKTTGTRLLNIRFYAKNQFLFVEIEDNGIGRKKASEIVVQTKAHSHLSMATNNIKRMLNLLRQDGKIAELQYEDLYGAQDQPIGTKVTLILPDDLDESQLTDPDDILNET